VLGCLLTYFGKVMRNGLALGDGGAIYILSPERPIEKLQMKICTKVEQRNFSADYR
jgi:hypothetical protein